MSYVIRNCPSILRMTKVCDAYETTRDLPQLCKDCTGCVLKRIVELSKEESSIIQHKQKVKVKGLNKLADRIFELLDIQEIECEKKN